VVLKSQIATGGRGKAGGIQIVQNEDELPETIKRLLNLPIKGLTPSILLAEEVLAIDRELYLSLVINREDAVIELVANKQGGVEVEENDAASFLRLPLRSSDFLAAGERLAELFDLPDQAFALQEITKNLFSCFVTNDATLLEINPLILTKKHGLVAGDCKMELDDAAAFRHPEWKFEETIANANFVTIDPNGQVATIANGAGLGMATVDAVAEAGLTAANFLDIGGGATSESVLAAFQQIMEYPHIKAIVINIFAGITRCDEVARAIIAAKDQISSLPPLSIRLAGTSFEQAVELLNAKDIRTFATLEECLADVHEVTNE
ncbi:MAG: sucC, partial [Candidatus Saccharibacteria bacterium]|nr:sucC [Candidatus Saccharibacteria bacterium]